MWALRRIGEGALVGAVAGSGLALSQILAHGDLQHGATLLPLIRLVHAAQLFAALGVSISVALVAMRVLTWPGSGPARLLAEFGALVVGVGIAILALRDPLTRLSLAQGVDIAARATAMWLTLGLAASLVALRFRDLRGWGAAFLGFSALAALVVCSLLLPIAGRSRAAGHPSVLLISIDTLRADRLGVLGNQRGLTPNLDRLAREGVFFVAATASAPWTKPSHASIFTSLLPYDHRARWNRVRIPARHSLLAERLRDAGYRNAAFTGGASVHADAGFDQGFEIYENHHEIDEGGAEIVFANATDWACAQGEARYFLFLHTYDVHIPYSHVDLANPSHAGRLDVTFDYEALEKIRAGDFVPTKSEIDYVIDLYDGGVAHVDGLVGRLLAALEDCGALTQTIVVIVSDHGEDLWDHEPTRSPDHGHSLYEDLLNVPLIIWYPASIPAGSQIDTPVSLLAVAPTLLSLAGLPADPEHHGDDLAPTLRAGSQPPTTTIFSESVEYGPERFAARRDNLKVIVTPFPEHSLHARLEVAPLEIFDLASDPGERHPLPSASTPAAIDLLGLVLSRADLELTGSEEAAVSTAPLSARRRENLRALGYIE